MPERVFDGGAMDRREQAALLVTLRRTALPWTEVRRRIDYAGSAIAVVDELAVPAAPTLDEVDFDLETALADAEADIARWRADGIGLVTMLDADYPEHLRTVHDHPPFLHYRGTVSPDDAAGVAVVGTRHATADGTKLATDIADALADAGHPVISGLAAGIDAAAHRAALRAGRRTVAVIGTGVRRSYPVEHRDLQDQIAARGLVLSQFWPDAAPSRQSFPMRNAVMSGYSMATVVVEASQTSGARMQAGLALRHGRPVILMSRLLGHDWAHEMAGKPGVTVATSAADVLAAIADLIALQAEELTWA